MTEADAHVAAVITATGTRVILGPRTSATIEAITDRQSRIEALGKGSIEVRADFAGGSVTIALKEVTEPVRIGSLPSAR